MPWHSRVGRHVALLAGATVFTFAQLAQMAPMALTRSHHAFGQLGAAAGLRAAQRKAFHRLP